MDFDEKFSNFAFVVRKRRIASVNGFPAGKKQSSNPVIIPRQKTPNSFNLFSIMLDSTNCIPSAGELALNANAANTESAETLNESTSVDNSANNASLASMLDAEDFLYTYYCLRRNVLNNKVEFRAIDENESQWRPVTAKALNSIILRSHREGYVGKYDISGDIKLLVESEDIPEYDPIKDWLEKTEWDGKDRVVDFWKRIPGVTATQLYHLCIYHRSMVAHWLGIDLEHGNECIPTLIGAQGCGKSTFCIRVLPPHLRQYYLDNFNLGNKNDKNMALSDSLLICLDEMDQYKPGQQAELKQAVSKTTVNGRKIYGRTHENRPRRASFIGTTNNTHPLMDSTGSRRYLCITIPAGELIDNLADIDYEQLYAQLVYEVTEKKERYWFTNEETKEIQKMNAPFMQMNSVEQMVEFCVRKPKGDDNSTLSADELYDALLREFPMAATAKVTKSKLGRVMRSLGFDCQHTNKGMSYHAVLRKK